MKLTLVCVSVVLLGLLAQGARPRPKSRRRSEVAEAFDEAGVTEELDITAPDELLRVIFGEYEQELGNEIYAGNTIQRPELEWSGARPGRLYTWLLIDPDFFSSENEECRRTYAFAVYMNIEDLGDLCSAYEAAKYLSPQPRPGTGYHNYVSMLYKQKEKIDTSCDNGPDYDRYRIGFDLAQFASNYSLSGPVAGNFHKSVFPDNLEEACKEVCESCEEEESEEEEEEEDEEEEDEEEEDEKKKEEEEDEGEENC